MNISKKRIKKIPRGLQWRFFLVYKHIHQFFMPGTVDKSILFIFGCQRSGTTLTKRIFQRDLQSKVFEEFSVLSNNDPEKIRLNSYESVMSVINSLKAPFIVLKPLVESQNTLELLSQYKGSKAVWLYRNYRDVARSNLRYFGENNGIKDLRNIIDGKPESWKAEKMSEHVLETIKKYFAEDMNKFDAAALFWFARNSIFFDQSLGESPDIMMCRYEDLVSEPEKILQQIYEFTGRPFPGKSIVGEVHTSSLGKGKDIGLSPEIDKLCRDLLTSLDEAYQSN